MALLASMGAMAFVCSLAVAAGQASQGLMQQNCAPMVKSDVLMPVVPIHLT